MVSIRKTAKKIEQFVVYRIFHVDDTPHRLALGIALGFFVAWTPTMGFQMLLVLLLAPLIKANGRVGLPIVWISNPLTMLFIYGPNYWLGRHFLNLFLDRPVVTWANIKEALSGEYIGWLVAHYQEPEFWHNLSEVFRNFLHISLDLWVGSVFIGFIIAAVMYVISYKTIVWYRTHSQFFHLHLRRRERAAARKKDKE